MDDWKLYCPKCSMVMTLFGVGEIGDDYLYGKKGKLNYLDFYSNLR